MPKYENEFYDELARTPSLGYLVGRINSVAIPICMDTGAGKSLMSMDTWRKVNTNGSMDLKPQYRGFEAVNGSRINCQGSAVVKLMLMGEKKNYVGYFQFFVVDEMYDMGNE